MRIPQSIGLRRPYNEIKRSAASPGTDRSHAFTEIRPAVSRQLITNQQIGQSVGWLVGV